MGTASDVHCLDEALLHAVFSNLDANDLLTATATCRAWASAGTDDRLWESAFRRFCSSTFLANTSHQLGDMVAAAGSWRRLAVWRVGAQQQRSRLWVEGKTPGGTEFLSIPCSISSTDDGQLNVTTGPHNRVCIAKGHMLEERHAVWSPCGTMVVYTSEAMQPSGILGSSFRAECSIKNYKGQTVARADLKSPNPPFYYLWSPCGSRVAMLSAYHHNQVGLQVMEVPQAAVIQCQRDGAARQGNDAPGQAYEQPLVVYLSSGAMLFFTWSPDGRQILQMKNGTDLSVVDVEGALEHMCSPISEISADSATTGEPGRVEIVDVTMISQEYDHQFRSPLWQNYHNGVPLVMVPDASTVTLEWPGRQSSGGSVALTSLSTRPHDADTDTAQASALVEGNLQVGEYHLFTVSFSATDNYSAAALLDERPRLTASFASDLYKRQHRIWPDDSWSTVAGCTEFVSMQWSPKSHRALMLFTRSTALSDSCAASTSVQHQREAADARWVIWEQLPSGRPAVTLGNWYKAPRFFMHGRRNFWDAYNQSNTPWASTSDAFCYVGLIPKDERAHVDDSGCDAYSSSSRFECLVYVQPVPMVSKDSDDDDSAAVHTPLIRMAPPPTIVAKGHAASWSPQ